MGMFKNNYAALICKEPTRTQQHFKQETNINNIISKYKRTGYLPVIQNNQPMFGDFSRSADYHDMLTQVAIAKEAFEQLPVEIKKKFHQDPGKMIDFVLDKSNYEAAVEMGLITPPAVENLTEIPDDRSGEGSNQPSESDLGQSGLDSGDKNPKNINQKSNQKNKSR